MSAKIITFPDTKFKVKASSLIPKISSLSQTGGSPVVHYSLLAYNKIKYIIDKCPKEVGWFGTVEEVKDGYLITDIYVPKQTVTFSETDIPPESLVDLAMSVEDPDKLIYWGHSHVHMPVNPSSQDQDQTAEYLDHTDIFIRGIYNKNGDSKVDIFDTRSLLCHECVTNKPIIPTLEESERNILDGILTENVKERVYTSNKAKSSRGTTTQSKRNRNNTVRNLENPFIIKGKEDK